MNCTNCGKELKDYETVYQIRAGFLEKDEDFTPEEDIAYLCEKCTPELLSLEEE